MIIPKKISKLRHKETHENIVIGGGLSGLLTSAFLLQQGQNVLLLEKLEKLGGRTSPESRNGFLLGAGFRFADAGAWRQCADRLKLNSNTLRITNGGALLHSTRGWIEPEEIPAWESYYSTLCTEYPEQGMYGMISGLLAFCESHTGFSAVLESPVTALEIIGGRAKKAIIGADHEIELNNCYWTAEYKGLLEVLRGEGVPEVGPERVSWLKKFMKSTLNPGVILEFAHKQKVGDFTETLLMPFSSGEKEERRYLVGAFSANRDPSLAPAGKQLSSWILPLTEAEWGDNHETMKKIRSARRLLEKAFPNFESTIEFDRVLVLDQTASPQGKKKGEWHALLPNLKIFADWAAPQGATPESLCALLLEQFS